MLKNGSSQHKGLKADIYQYYMPKLIVNDSKLIGKMRMTQNMRLMNVNETLNDRRALKPGPNNPYMEMLKQSIPHGLREIDPNGQRFSINKESQDHQMDATFAKPLKLDTPKLSIVELKQLVIDNEIG